MFEEAMDEDEAYYGDVTNVNLGRADENCYGDGEVDVGVDDD